MGKFTKAQAIAKQSRAKELYVKGFEIETIAEILEVAVSTVKKWATDNDFETARQSSFIALGEIRKILLESFIDLKDGKKPKIKPDEAAKFAAAFDKLSDKKKVLSYMYESFDMLTDELTKDIQAAKTNKDKETALAVLKKFAQKQT